MGTLLVRKSDRRLIILVVGFLYYFVAVLARNFASTPNSITPIWPSDGIAAAAVLFFGTWVYPGIWLGSFLSNVFAFFDTSSPIQIGLSLLKPMSIGIGNTLSILMGAWLFQLLIKDRLTYYEQILRSLLFSTCVAVVSPVINATWGVTTLALAGSVPWSHYPTSWTIWWGSNVGGILIMAPLLLSWGEIFRQPEMQASNQYLAHPAFWGPLIELLALFTGIAIIVHYGFKNEVKLEYALIPLVTWVALRYAFTGAALTVKLFHLNIDLEDQVQQRTNQLKQALEFEALLKRITDKVRDSLDERQIMHTTVEELAKVPEVCCCDAGIYNLEQRASTITYESRQSDIPSALGKVVPFTDFSDIYAQLLRGEHLQFSLLAQDISLRNKTKQFTILACPIVDDQAVLGDMWLLKRQTGTFNDQEVKLVQQVANQCAIALRQARLYQNSQAQIQDLERVNQMKDDFLSTVSHELRTPITNIRMATKMLEIVLEKEELNQSTQVSCYLSILQKESTRENNLINDLLDIARLESSSESDLNKVCLQTWIPPIAASYAQQAIAHHCQLLLDLTDALPPVIYTDANYLERILSELLHNACKYTPTGETIRLSVGLQEDQLQIQVINTGIEISTQEFEHIFEKFYRIPNNDPWKHGGTGLGLALVKKLVDLLHGTISVTSSQNQVAFTLLLPITTEVDPA